MCRDFLGIGKAGRAWFFNASRLQRKIYVHAKASGLAWIASGISGDPPGSEAWPPEANPKPHDTAGGIRSQSTFSRHGTLPLPMGSE